MAGTPGGLAEDAISTSEATSCAIKGRFRSAINHAIKDRFRSAISRAIKDKFRSAISHAIKDWYRSAICHAIKDWYRSAISHSIKDKFRSAISHAKICHNPRHQGQVQICLLLHHHLKTDSRLNHHGPTEKECQSVAAQIPNTPFFNGQHL